MSFVNHPLEPLVRTLGVHGDEYRNAERQTTELARLYGILSTMTPGDLQAAETLRWTMTVLTQINQAVGTIHGWTHAQHGRVHAEAVRLLGAEQTDITAPNWVEP